MGWSSACYAWSWIDSEIVIVIMKKVLLFSALALSFMMSSCKDPLVGTWVQPGTTYTPEQGFVLEKNGKASGVNMDFVKFETWKKKGNMLIISGENTGSLKGEFVDTLMIKDLTDDVLILSQSGYTMTYRRKLEK